MLSDVFEKFRNLSIENYGLDPCNSFSSPGLIFDATIKMAVVKLDCISDIEMYQIIEKGIRGRVSIIAGIVKV